MTRTALASLFALALTAGAAQAYEPIGGGSATLAGGGDDMVITYSAGGAGSGGGIFGCHATCAVNPATADSLRCKPAYCGGPRLGAVSSSRRG